MSDRTAEHEAIDCARVIRDEIAEQYVAGRLGDAEAAAFEGHYFTCDRCLADVEAWRTMRTALEPGRRAAHARTGGGVALWPWAAAAAVVVLASAAIFRYWPSRTQPAGRVDAGASSAPQGPGAAAPLDTPPAPVMTLAALAAVEPPPYAPMRVRGASDEAARRFGEAMTRYQARDYAGAIPGLEAAAALDAKLAAAQFYLGACFLVTGNAAHAIDRLTLVTTLGETGYLEEAQYFLAKAQLRAGNIGAARAALTRTVALHGDREGAARKLLDDLARLDGGSGGRQ